MTFEYGIGMLFTGLVAIAIGATIAFFIINKYVDNKNKGDNDEIKR
tara:strand:- start:866 stop:1003 length:138 start_codon:yes stop_codon:yes gene_type:complete